MKNPGKFIFGMIAGGVLLYIYFSIHGALPGMNAQPSGFVVTNNTGSSLFDASAQYKKYQSLYELLDNTYYDKQNIDIEVMQENALKGFVDALGDPYTVYLTQEENTIFDEGMQGSQNFEGIGAVVTKKDDGILIESVLKGSPAFEAGLLPLDLILQIDGEGTSDLGLNEGVQRIRGEKGTPVVLTIYREGEETIIEDFTVIRGEISVPSVEGEMIETGGKNILHLTVSVFGDDTIKIFEQVIGEYNGKILDGVILDLRGNGGGYLPIASELTSYFLTKNEVITTAKYTIFDDETFRSKGYQGFQGISTVVLIDGLSASASEIMASALQERGDAVIVGETSFGKGSIQTIHTNEDNSSLKFTVGKWYTPNDENVDGIGLSPTQEVLFDADLYQLDGTDTQFEAAVTYLLENN